MPELLAIDLGLRTGLACFGGDGRLRWYRSQNYGNRARLRRGAHGVLKEHATLTHIVAEGGGALAQLWENEARKRGTAFSRVEAHVWRQALLLDRHQRSGKDAKEQADVLARRVIAWSGAAAPTSLRHDAAEAILVGLWAVQQQGWLETLPPPFS